MERAYHTVRKAMEQAAEKSGRRSEDITLVAVSKNGTIEQIRALVALGQRDFGENRVQSLLERMAKCEKNLCWHCIGQLQSNKVKYIIKQKLLIHSLDRQKLAGEIDRQAKKNDTRMRVLVQVKFDEKKGRGGIAPGSVIALLDDCAEFTNLAIEGLMCMAPPDADERRTRTCFTSTRNLFDELKTQRWPNVNMKTLSMGMSRDYQLAIEHGATMVRVGSALFQSELNR